MINNKKRRNKGRRMKQNILLCYMLLLVVLCIGCGRTKEVEKHVHDVIATIETGDMEKINEIIFGYQDVDVDYAIEGVQEAAEYQGILGEIFKRTSITVTQIKDQQIEYEIESPDLSGIFAEILENGNVLPDKEFENYLKEYINQAESKKKNVVVPYNIVDGKIQVNYREKEFINAITGGLLESYQKVYQEMVENYAEGGGT